MKVPKNHQGEPSAREHDMKRMDAGSWRDLAGIEMPVLRLLKSKTLAGTRMPARSTTAS
jgi:hypothetical protein